MSDFDPDALLRARKVPAFPPRRNPDDRSLDGAADPPARFAAAGPDTKGAVLPKDDGRPWTMLQDATLRRLAGEGRKPREIAPALRRPAAAVKWRLVELGIRHADGRDEA